MCIPHAHRNAEQVAVLCTCLTYFLDSRGSDWHFLEKEQQMNRRNKHSQMRAAFRVITRTIVEQVIFLARYENRCASTSPAQRGGAKTAATSAYAGRVRPSTVEQFVNALPKQERAELASLMVLGREPHMVTARDLRVTCTPSYWRLDLGQYLASKGALAAYLTEGMKVVGL